MSEFKQYAPRFILLLALKGLEVVKMLTRLNRFTMLLCILVTMVAQTYSLSSVASVSNTHIGMAAMQSVSESSSNMAMICQGMSTAEAMACCMNMADSLQGECCDCDANCASMQCASSVFTANSAGLNMRKDRHLLSQLQLHLPVQSLSSLYRPPITH